MFIVGKFTGNKFPQLLLPENVFISLLLLKDTLTGYRILGWCIFFSFNCLNIWVYLLACMLCDKKLDVTLILLSLLVRYCCYIQLLSRFLSLSLVVYGLNMIHLGVVFFCYLSFSLLSELPWLCFNVIAFKKFSAIIISNTYLVFCLYLLTFLILSFWISVWKACTDISSRLMILELGQSVLLMCPSNAFFISDCVDSNISFWFFS